MSDSDRIVPSATYRVQLHSGFTLDDAAQIADYLNDLGITHIYCSPFLQAASGSKHGYDVVDHTRINDELGGLAAHRRLSDVLGRLGMGHILDVVPNHMAIAGRRSAWWWDVLKHGPASNYARFFDIDWDPPERQLAGKILVPILGDHYGRVLEAGEMEVARDEEEIFVRYHEHEVPITPGSIDVLPGAPADPDEAIAHINSDPALLHTLLESQHYRLAFWRTDLELNYRRFFDINDLVALRMEEPEVFDHVHDLALQLIEDGELDGLRIDHVDGLHNPEAYLSRLRERAPDAYILVEKILGTGETLPRSWPVDGTTGYEWLNDCSRLSVDPAGEKPLLDLYVSFVGEEPDLDELKREKKHLVMTDLLPSDLERVTAMLVEVCERHPRHRDYTRHELREALKEVTAALEVYRTYIDAEARTISSEDAERIDAAVAVARERRPDIDTNLFDFLTAVLTLRHEGRPETEFIMRWQQTTGPIMAKAIEDTLFYDYCPLVSLNEVGGDPERWSTTVEEFHNHNAVSARDFPNTMLTTSTHDTKRSEDVRMRIHTLSEIPDAWGDAVRRWTVHNARYKSADMPDRNTEYFLYQTLVGAYRLDEDRAVEYMRKATKEAKRFTSWTDPNPEFDVALDDFVRGLLGDPEFTRDLNEFVAPLITAGRINSLAQTVLKLTSPGVPDIYQGTELWDLSLVDPDNRRPVDYETRRLLLEFVSRAGHEEVLARSDTGAPKLFVIQRILALRAKRPELFDRRASYQPLPTHGDFAVAFSRSQEVVVVVPRLTLSRPPQWTEATVTLPVGEWRNVFTEESAAREVALGRLLAQFPVAVLVKGG
ncbi:MAG TPA: malto-oligosyltrehalose synthase [Actinomycetota bacterium]|nr:malto-oligosyltrehalose synthase [Actinomycetota bacterium]